MGKFSDIPYTERSDPQKTETQWGKALGLISRRDWSAAVVRAVTAIEISLNHAIRREHTGLTTEQVNTLLLRANGVARKLDILDELISANAPDFVPTLRMYSGEASLKRNRIVHSGEFCGEAEARAHVDSCREFVNALMGRYEQGFALKHDEIPPDQDLGA